MIGDCGVNKNSICTPTNISYILAEQDVVTKKTSVKHP